MEIFINLNNLSSANSYKTIPSILVKNTQVKTDSRFFQDGDVFVALTGKKFDGHSFIDQIKDKAIAIIYDPKIYTPVSADTKFIAVNNTKKSYQEIAYMYRRKLINTKVIALTGSTGKTTLKEILRETLAGVGIVCATEKNNNNEIGVPKTILSITPQTQFAIIEIGARRLGDIEPLVKICAPDAVVITGVGKSHIGEFGSLENIYKTKLEIIRHSAPGCIKIGPNDDVKIVSEIKKYPSHLTIGHKDKANIKLVAVDQYNHGMTLSYLVSDRELNITLPIYHSAMPKNIGFALAVFLGFQLNIDEAINKLSDFRGIPGRYFKFTVGEKTFIDDSYNSSPESMSAGLESFGRSFSNKSKVLVLGDMMELGAESIPEHQKIGHQIFEQLNKFKLITVGPLASVIADICLRRGFDNSFIKKYSNTHEVLNDLDKILYLGDYFYIKASNSVGLSRVIDRLKKGD